MQVILAVDIVEGKVVKAFAGIRSNYKPLFINHRDYSNPIVLIKEIIKKTNLKKIYIADIDAIRKRGDNGILIDRILNNFPNITFLIDAGFQYPISVYNYHKRKLLKNIENYNVVLGTETIKNYNLKSYKFSKKFELSIDFNGKESKWLQKIKKEKHTMDITLMFLDKVGGRGLDVKFIKKLYNNLSNHNLSLAGGIKTDQQIKQLSRIGFKSILSSTLMHKKYLGTVN